MHQKNNFDCLRLIFALFVIISHAYPLSGEVACDYLCQISHGQILFADIGVKGFFIISGYLIFQSLERSKNIYDYFWKRFVRLFPALFVVLLLTVILAPLVYNSAMPLFQNKSFWTYLPRNLSLYKLQYSISGIFETNPYNSGINGSLWTIEYEFTMYVLLAALFVFRNQKNIMRIILITSFFILLIWNLFFIESLQKYVHLLVGGKYKYLLDLGVFFIAGSVLSIISIEKINHKKIILSTSILLMIIAVYLGYWHAIKFITLPIAIILLGIMPIPFICNMKNKIGDLSYGIYIYAFPIQQTLVYYFKFNPIELMFTSMLITLPFAYLSWHLIEKKALNYKDYKRFNTYLLSLCQWKK